MNISGMLHGAGLLKIVDFPTSEVLGPEASDHEIHSLIEKCGSVFVKPIFRGGVGKKGKSGLLGRAKDLKSALAEKERLYFAEHRSGNAVYKSRGSLSKAPFQLNTRYIFRSLIRPATRAVMTLTHHGGMDIEELDKSQIIEVPFDPLTGLKSFIVSNALTDLGAPRKSSPRWCSTCQAVDLYHHYGMSRWSSIHPHDGRQIRISDSGGLRFQMRFDRDDPRVNRLDLPVDLFVTESNDFEQESTNCAPTRGRATFT